MIAVKFTDAKEFGCPNCGCNYFYTDNAYTANQPGCTCKHCNLHFQVLGDGVIPSTRFDTGRKDANNEHIMEKAIEIQHPRKGIPAWKWEAPDDRPPVGEYANSRGVGYDLAVFVRSRKAGLRILQMVHEVLGLVEPGKDYTKIPTDQWATAKSWLDYRDYEPARIQFKFNPAEFNIERLDKAIISNDNIVTKTLLEQYKIGEEFYETK